MDYFLKPHKVFVLFIVVYQALCFWRRNVGVGSKLNGDFKFLFPQIIEAEYSTWFQIVRETKGLSLSLLPSSSNLKGIHTYVFLENKESKLLSF